MYILYMLSLYCRVFFQLGVLTGSYKLTMSTGFNWLRISVDWGWETWCLIKWQSSESYSFKSLCISIGFLYGRCVTSIWVQTWLTQPPILETSFTAASCIFLCSITDETTILLNAIKIFVVIQFSASRQVHNYDSTCLLISCVAFVNAA